MISAFGVEHGEISKGVNGGMLFRMGAKAAKKSGAASEMRAAGSANADSFSNRVSQMGDKSSKGWNNRPSIEGTHSGFAGNRAPKKGMSGLLNRSSKSFRSGHTSALNAAHHQGGGSTPIPKFLQ
jgi:hypothetical protein